MVEKIPLRKAIAKTNAPPILAFGNPLVDILIFFKNDEFLKKHQILINEREGRSHDGIEELLADVPSEAEKITSAGGSAQNTMKILQWLCDETFQSKFGIYCGAIGDDSYGAMLEKSSRTTGVDIRYTVNPTVSTGICLSLINESSRSLVFNTGAAAEYNLTDLKKCGVSLDKIKILYIEGWFITHSFLVAKDIITQAEERDITVVFNLNRIFKAKSHHAAIFKMVGYAKIVFGNAEEMVALADALKIKYDDVTDIPFLLNNVKKITVSICTINNEDWLRYGGVFVMSQGSSAPAIVVWGKGESAQVQPITPKSPVVDKTGASDALVAGFLAGALAQRDPKSCLELGCKAASFIVTRRGVKLPTNVPPDLLQ